VNQTDKKSKKRIIFLLKVAFTLGALYVVLTQADLSEIWSYIKKADPLYLLIALLVINFGQVISGLRMRYYFGTDNLIMTRKFSILLYYLGMLFNLILPGGIGGDGYKAYILKKKLNFCWKSSIRLILCARASGLLFLFVVAFLMCYASDFIMSLPYAPFLVTLGLIGIFPCYSICARYILREKLSVQIGAAKYSFWVQAIVAITAFFILESLGFEGDKIDYLILFILSSITSILPISIGGIGLRELTFFYCAPFMALDPELGVAISAIYFIVNSIASLPGLYFYHEMGKIEIDDNLVEEYQQEK